MIPIAGSGLCVSYNGTRAVANLDFAVREGSWVALIGPNGAGKTTVLRAVAGLQPFEGELRIGSADVKGVSRRSLARLIAYVPQRPVLPSGMTVTDYVLMGRNPYIDYFSTERSTDLDAVEEALQQVRRVCSDAKTQMLYVKFDEIGPWRRNYRICSRRRCAP